MAMRDAALPLLRVILEKSLASGGFEVERRVTSHIVDDGFWWCGAAEARRRLHVVLRAHGGGAFWSRASVDVQVW
jgi:hypothetical protein